MEGIAGQEDLLRKWLADPTMQALRELYKQASEFELHYDENGNIDWQTTLEQEAGESLKVCSHNIGGVCGISIGYANSAGMGVRFSFDFVVDQQGQLALYASPGGGAYLTTTIVDAGGGISVFAVPHANVDDIKGWSVQVGGSAKEGLVGVGIETIFVKNEGRVFSGLSISLMKPGVGNEVHATATYGIPIYHSHYPN